MMVLFRSTECPNCDTRITSVSTPDVCPGCGYFFKQPMS